LTIEKGMALTLGVTFETGQLTPEEWALVREITQNDQGPDGVGSPCR
jgi:hypothetical protein